MTSEATYELLCAHARERALLYTVQMVLEWDERTTMPAAAGPYRAEQVKYLAGIAHQKQTEPQVGEWLAELSDSPLAKDPYSDTGAVIRRLKRDYDKKSKLPKELVEELAHTSSIGQQVWAEARKADDFASFRPYLEKTIGLKQQEAAAVGYDDTPYDVLMDDFDPGEKTAAVTGVLAALREELVPLVEAIMASSRRPETEILHRHYDVKKQAEFGRKAAEAVGFDFAAGRLDTTDHPFCIELGPYDVGLATRYDEQSFEEGFFSTLHEAGHGIYEQGLPDDDFGLPTGQQVSMGIHESQSRLFENLLGRSHAFWEYFYPEAQIAFPTALADVPLDSFHFAINGVERSLIRTDADEATYNLHIMIRFELELALIGGELAVADLPAAWNAKYHEYLGIDPPNDADGVMQDVHWSAGLFGYFPSYSLGNLYAAQLFEQAREDLGDLAALFRRGEFLPVRDWLHEAIYQHGRRYSPAELVQRVTGKPLSHDALMRHLYAKYGSLYGLT